MQPARKISVVKQDTNRVSMRNDDPDRDFWIQTRRALLAQVDAIEKRLGIVRRCNRCGETLSS